MQGNSYQSSDWIKVFNTFKSGIFRELKVCRIGKIESVKGNQIIVKDLNDGLQIICHSYLESVDSSKLSSGKVVCILCTDLDYRANLNRIKQNLDSKNSNTTSLHNINYGIIIGFIGGINE